jgi:hypothetical protein
MQLTPGAVVELVFGSDLSCDSTEPLIAMVVYSYPGRAGLWLGDDPLQHEKLQGLIGKGAGS